MDKSELAKIAKASTLYNTQEAPLKVGSKNRELMIGIPKEVDPTEKRVALKPEAVATLVNNGHEVIVETGAGQSSKHLDQDYSEAGARIAYNAKEVYGKADIIVKIAPLTLAEIEMCSPNQTVFSALHPAKLAKEYLEALTKKKLTALAFEHLADEDGGLPIVRTMGEIAGSTSILIAAEYLNTVNEGQGVVLGGITGVPPTKVVILGAGTVAEYAARTALGLGAEVKIFDNHIYRLMRIKQHLPAQHVYTCTLDTAVLKEALKSADVVIGALRAKNGRTPCVVTEEMVQEMKTDSVIVDVSIDHGGCFETSQTTTHENPVFRKYGVIHYGVPNIAARVARTGTAAISNILTPLLLKIGDMGGVEQLIFDEQWFANSIYCYKGGITNRDISKKYKLTYKDLRLIIAATR